MALVRTTLTAAILVGDTSIAVTSATGFLPGYWIRIDQEMMKVGAGYTNGLSIPVSRGQDGTANQAHPVTAGVVVGTGADWTSNPLQTPVQYPIAGRIVTIESYTASGAIAFPKDGCDTRAILNGTGALAMTLAVPTVDLDGHVLTIVGNGKAAHTVTVAGGIGAAGAGYTVLTFDTGGQCAVQFIAANAVWLPLPSPLSGTLTAADVAVA